MLVHVPVCVTDDEATAQAALRASLGYFPYTPNYAAMFDLAGYPNSEKTGWTDDLGEHRGGVQPVQSAQGWEDAAPYGHAS